MKIAAVLLLLFLVAGCGGYGSNNTMSGGGSAPAISALVPNTATAGDPAFTLTVNGSGFAANSTVYWNAGGRSTTFVSAKQLTAAISAGDVAAAGTIQVYVRNAGGIYGGGVNSNMVSFTVN